MSDPLAITAPKRRPCDFEPSGGSTLVLVVGTRLQPISVVGTCLQPISDCLGTNAPASMDGNVHERLRANACGTGPRASYTLGHAPSCRCRECRTSQGQVQRKFTQAPDIHWGAVPTCGRATERPAAIVGCTCTEKKLGRSGRRHQNMSRQIVTALMWHAQPKSAMHTRSASRVSMTTTLPTWMSR